LSCRTSPASEGGVGENRLPYLPHNRRSRSPPYGDIPPTGRLRSLATHIRGHHHPSPRSLRMPVRDESGEEMPDEDGQFTGRGDRGDLFATPSADTQEECAQRAGVFAATHAASTSVPRACARPCLVMRP